MEFFICFFSDCCTKAPVSARFAFLATTHWFHVVSILRPASFSKIYGRSFIIGNFHTNTAAECDATSCQMA